MRTRNSIGKGSNDGAIVNIVKNRRSWRAVMLLSALLILPAIACTLPGSSEATATPTAVSTDAPTQAPPATATEEATEAATATEAPTEAPTQAPTQAPTEPPATETAQPTTEGTVGGVRPTAVPTPVDRVVTGDFLNVELDPGFGEVDLVTGFAPDPHAVALISGGDIDVNALDLGSDCAGFAVTSPDFRLNWEGETDFLRIFFEANEDGEDATLIINEPSGDWLCNDDFVGFDPLVQIDDPETGPYDIWVGSFSPGDFLEGILYITELDFGPGDLADADPDRGLLDFTLEANSGSDALSSGFSPDPWQVNMVAGGEVEAFAQDLGPECVGYTSSAPDYHFDWTGSTNFLRLFFVADSVDDDATLVVRGSDGNWYCNDDSDGFDPLIQIDDPASGGYDVWVGSFLSNDDLAGTLYITELDLSPGDVSDDGDDAGILDPSLEPNFGAESLAAGFPDDPFSVTVISGGTVDADALDLGPECTGYATSAPDFRLEWAGTSDLLRVFFVAGNQDDDATLIINDPDGNWLCSDDFEDLNPLIQIDNPSEGQYDIWVGSFAPDDFVAGELYITEVELSPSDVAFLLGMEVVAL